jgi:UDP-N-acetylmuramate--alanine ligase
MELLGQTASGAVVYDDYAHHPTEVATMVAAARSLQPRRVIAVFQPHLFTRTRAFAAEFGRALAAADLVVVMDVYPAREDPIPGVTGEIVAAAVPLPPDRVRFEPDAAAVPDLVAGLARPGDVVVTIGAGDVTAIGPLVLDRLADRNG